MSEKAPEKIKVTEEQVQAPEQKSEDWPSDYFECLQPVFTVSEADEKSQNHYEKFLETGNEKELITAIMLSARIFLDMKFGFKELTLSEIKSLVEISKKVVSLANERNIKKFTPTNEINFGKEATAQWLNENYSIDMITNFVIELSLSEEEKGQGIGIEDLNKRYNERRNQFVDYVRKVRDKALLAEKK